MTIVLVQRLFATYLVDVSFLKPPSGQLPPLVQEIWHRSDFEVTRPIDELVEQAIDNPLNLSEQERRFLLSRFTYSWARQYFIAFPSQVNSPFRVGDNNFNISHPAAALLFRSMAWVFLARKRDKRGNANVGRLQDAVNPLLEAGQSYEPMKIEAQISNLYSAAFEVGLLDSSSSIVSVKPEDLWYVSAQSINQLTSLKEFFGQVINS